MVRLMFIRVEVGIGFRQGPSTPQAARTNRAEEKTACSGRDDSGKLGRDLCRT